MIFDNLSFKLHLSSAKIAASWEMDVAKGSSIETEMRSDIVRGVYPPSSRLRLDVLKTRFDVGFSPIREALSRLQGEGLVELEPNRGFRVKPLSKEDLLDIAATRSMVEVQALRLSIEHGGDAWENALVAAMHHYRRKSEDAFASEANLQAWEEAHDALHVALISACGSARLLELQKRLQDQHLRYRRLIVIPQVSAHTHIEEHEQLVSIALSRNADAAVSMVQKHMMITVDALSQAVF